MQHDTISPPIPPERSAAWHGAAKQELQHLIATASEFRSRMDSAQTQSKRAYYEKKIRKITPDVIRMLKVLDATRTNGQETM